MSTPVWCRSIQGPLWRHAVDICVKAVIILIMKEAGFLPIKDILSHMFCSQDRGVKSNVGRFFADNRLRETLGVMLCYGKFVLPRKVAIERAAKLRGRIGVQLLNLFMPVLYKEMRLLNEYGEAYKRSDNLTPEDCGKCTLEMFD